MTGKTYHCIDCNRSINHKGRCLACNTKNKKNNVSEPERLSPIAKELKIPVSGILTVSQLSDYIAQKFSKDSKLSSIYLIGEVSNLRNHSSGHTYFDLKDGDALISCVIWKGSKLQLRYQPEDKKEILVLASVETYKNKGLYQLIVTQAYPVGEGLVHSEFRKLKEKLKKKGMFDIKHKREIPLLPRCIGIASSIQGSAIRDVLDAIKNRFPNMDIIIAPTVVQGSKGANSIIDSIKILNRIDEIDAIILARGGGSVEDLDCFNGEEVAKAIYNSKKPIISAVGHEDDWTISDYVADVRAITPTHSAELAVMNKGEEIAKLEEIETQLSDLIAHYKTRSKVTTYQQILVGVLIFVFLAILITIYILWRLL